MLSGIQSLFVYQIKMVDKKMIKIRIIDLNFYFCN